MENQLIQIYLFVCQIYDTCSDTCFQRTSNNSEPLFTDQELITIWLFAHLNGFAQKKQMHRFIKNYWQSWFPRLPAYQTFVYRLNLLETTFQTFGKVLLEALHREPIPEIDRIVDSLPVMLAQQGHSYSARVAREVADAGFCAAKKTRFHGIRLHVVAERCNGRLPKPVHIWLCQASIHDSKAFANQPLKLPDTTLFGDLAYAASQITALLKEQNTKLIAPKKKPKGKELSEIEKYHNRLVSKFRQPIESLFNWIIEKTNIQKASKVRSTDALMIHCWGKLAFAFFLLIFYY
jgi:hypothetical protein